MAASRSSTGVNGWKGKWLEPTLALESSLALSSSQYQGGGCLGLQAAGGYPSASLQPWVDFP